MEPRPHITTQRRVRLQVRTLEDVGRFPYTGIPLYTGLHFHSTLETHYCIPRMHSHMQGYPNLQQTIPNNNYCTVMATRTKQGQPTRQASKQTTKQLTTKQLLYCTVLYWCTNACNLVDDRTGQVRVPVGEGVGPTPMSQQVQNRRAGEFVPIRSDAIRHAMARSRPQHVHHVPPPRAYKYI